MTNVSPGNTNDQKVTREQGDLELGVQYVPAGITTAGVAIPQPGLTNTTVFPENIPEELKNKNIWINWKKIFVPGKEKPLKEPRNPKDTNRKASSDKHETWGEYALALFNYENNGMDGIGIATVSPVVVYDFDNCVHDGVLDPEIQEIVDVLDTYTELSQSQTGVHCIGAAHDPIQVHIEKGAVIAFYKCEIAVAKKFLYVTGNIYQNRNRIKTIDRNFHKLYELCIERKPAEEEVKIPDRVKRWSGSICDNWGLTMSNVGGMPDNARQVAPGVWQGSHPVHGSTTGNNYKVDGDRWICYRDGHKHGGGPLEFFAVKEGIISCEQSGPGCLDGKWPEVFKALEAAGYRDTSKKDERIREKKKENEDEISDDQRIFEMLKRQGKDQIDPITGVKKPTFILDTQKTALYLSTQRYQTISVAGTMGPVIWLYNGVHYEKDKGQLHTDITRYARVFNHQKQKNLASEIIDMIGGANFYPESPFNYKEGWIPCENGLIIIDFKKGEIRGPLPHNPDSRVTYCLPIKYNPDAPTGPVIDVLKQWVLSDDVDTLIQIPAQGFLQAMLDKTYKKAYLLQGEPDSGKSTYLKLIDSAFGTNTGVLSKVALQSITENNFSLAELENRIINAYDDLSSSELANYGKFKNLTGATHHDIEVKHKSSYPGRIFCTHVFTCNIPPAVPEIVSKEPAFWNRWEYVNFPYEMSMDTTFAERTFTPDFLSGFLNLIIKSMIEIYQTDKLKVRHTGDEIRERWRMDSDPLIQFINETFQPTGTTVRYDKDLLYTSYLDWCDENKIEDRRIIGTLEKFGRNIQKCGFFPDMCRLGKARAQCYTARVGGQLAGPLTPIIPEYKTLDEKGRIRLKKVTMS